MADRSRMIKKKIFLPFFLTALCLIQPRQLWAVGSAGFENASYSAKTLSQADAVTARPQDGSTILFNPAGIGELKGIQTNLGAQVLDWRIFQRSSVTGKFSENEFKPIPLPSFYLTVNPGKLLNDRFAFGVAVNSPFGLSNKFPSISVARYAGYKNSLKMFATTLAGSIRLFKNFRIGAGATHYHMFDYGQTFNYPNSHILGGIPAADGKAYTETTGGGWGWDMGLLYKPAKKHRLGLNYRSSADIQVHGRAVIEDLVLGSAQGFSTFPHFQTGAHSDVPIPASLTFGYAYEPSAKWSVESDLGLTFWNIFTDQDFEFVQPNAVLRSLGTIPRNYHNTWNIQLGGKYKFRDNVDLMSGFFFYEAAAPKNHVDNFLPDANRYGWTLGFTYRITPRMTVDFNYLFILFGTRNISNPAQLAKSGDNIDGRYTSIIHGPMVSFTYQFDFPFQPKK